MLGIGVPLVDANALFQLAGAAILLTICFVGATELPKKVVMRLEQRVPQKVFWSISYGVLLVILAVCLAFLVADSYNPFLYFRF